MMKEMMPETEMMILKISRRPPAGLIPQPWSISILAINSLMQIIAMMSIISIISIISLISPISLISIIPIMAMILIISRRFL